MKAQRVAQIGAGTTGIAVYQALRKRGTAVRIFDQGATTGDADTVSCPDPAVLAAAVKDWSPDVVVVSPGIPLHSELLNLLRGYGFSLISEVELAWQLQEAGSHRGRPWLCVTGTNGKTTTVGLLTHLLQSAGYAAKAVGNIGVPIVEQVDSESEVFVVELSSFQLETTAGIRPFAAICLNVKADHLDWHGSAEQYTAAKAKIYDGCTEARVYFVDDPVCTQMAERAKDAQQSKLVPISAAGAASGRFAVEGDCLVEHRDGRTSMITPISDVPFFVSRGRPPKLLEDIVAAVALARLYGVRTNAIAKALGTFEPKPHRQQVIAQFEDVTWIDDSKATNADAALAAMPAKPGSKIVWIFGGDAKGQDFTQLVQEVAPRLRKVIVIGKERQGLRRALADFVPKTAIVETSVDNTGEALMDEVIELAAHSAKRGDRVVLAPACASWDQFDNYAQRGDLFAASALRYIRGRRRGNG